MGIKNLYTIIKKSCSEIKPKDVTEYSGTTIAIDTSIFLHKYSNVEVLNANSVNIIPAQNIFFHAATLLLNNITPIYVFDGKPHKLKSDTILARKAAKQKAASNGAKTTSVTRDIVSSCKETLSLLGVKYIIADGEAETVCAILVQNGKCHAVASDDSDCIAYKNSILLRNFHGRMNNILEYSHNDIAREFNLTSIEFIRFCVLLGTDYSPPMAPKRALKAAKLAPKDIPMKLLSETQQFVFNLFNSPECAFTEHQQNMSLDNLSKYLTDFGISINKIQKTINKLNDKHKDNLKNTKKLHIYGFAGCGFFDTAIEFAKQNDKAIIIVETVEKFHWKEKLNALNSLLGTAHETSPYIYYEISTKNIFIGGFDNYKKYIKSMI